MHKCGLRRFPQPCRTPRLCKRTIKPIFRPGIYIIHVMPYISCLWGKKRQYTHNAEICTGNEGDIRFFPVNGYLDLCLRNSFVVFCRSKCTTLLLAGFLYAHTGVFSKKRTNTDFTTWSLYALASWLALWIACVTRFSAALLGHVIYGYVPAPGYAAFPGGTKYFFSKNLGPDTV